MQEDKEGDNDKMDIVESSSSLVPSILHPLQLRIIFGGKQLDNFSTLEENGIKNESTVLVAVAPFYTVSKNADKNKEGPSSTDTLFTSLDARQRVRFVLSLDDQASDSATQAFSPLEPLTPQDASALLSRVPSLEDETKTVTEPVLYPTTSAPKVSKPSFFKTRSQTAAATDPANALGAQLDRMSLEAPEPRENVVLAPVTVTHRSPTSGETTQAQAITIVFNRPFIPLFGAIEDHPVPYEISPAIKGARWQWVDGVTARYSSATPLPNSTLYTITQLPEVMTAYNTTIAPDTEPWTFSTATQLPIDVLFNDDINEPQVAIQFSQDLPENLLIGEAMERLITIETKGFRRYEITVLDHTDPETLNDLSKPIKQFVEAGNPKRLVVMTINETLPFKTTFSVVFGRGLASTEGPLKTTRPTSISFNTPSKFEIVMDKNQDFSCNTLKLTSTRTLKVFRFSEYTPEQLAERFVVKSVSTKQPITLTKVYTEYNRLVLEADYEMGSEYKAVIRELESETGEIISKASFTYSFPTEKASISMEDTNMFYPRAFNLDPLARPIIGLRTRAVSYVKVRAFPIAPHQYETYLDYHSGGNMWGDDPHAVKKIPMIPTATKEIQITREPKKTTETLIDLSEFFGGDTPMSAKSPLVLFEFISGEGRNAVATSIILQYTPFSISYKEIGSDTIVWVTNVATQTSVQTPLVELRQRGLSNPSVSILGSYGIATIPKTLETDSIVATVTIDKKSYVTFMPANIQKKAATEKIVWNVYNDVGCYRPTETVNIKGMIRISDENGIQTPLEYYGDTTLKDVKFTLTDTRRKEFFKDTVVPLNVLGCFHISFTLPEDINLGDSVLTMKANTFTHTMPVRILECQRKDFVVEIDANRSGSRQLANGTPFYLEAKGLSFTDEVLANTMVDWSVSVSERPPKALPTGYAFKSNDSSECPSSRFTHTSKRNPSGRHQLRLVLDQALHNMNVTVTGDMKDLTNKSESFSHSFDVAGSYIYFGASVFGSKPYQAKKFINIDEPFECEFIACRSNGKLVGEGFVKITISMMPWEEEMQPAIVTVTDMVPNSVGPSSFSHTFKQRGHYTVRLEYSHPQEEEVQAQTATIFVLGEQTAAEKEYREVAPQEVAEASGPNFKVPRFKPKTGILLSIQINNNGKKPDIGDTVEILVKGKLPKATGHLFVSKATSLIRIIPIALNDVGEFTTTHTIVQSDFPVINFVAYVEGRLSVVANGHTLTRTTNGFARQDLAVCRNSKSLEVEILPFRKFTTPSQSMSIGTRVLNSKKQPVANAEVTLVVADESLLALSKKCVADWSPISAFYAATTPTRPTASLLDSTVFHVPQKVDEVIVVPTSPIINITVRYLSGRVILIPNTPVTRPIDEIRRIIQERDGLPPSAQRLFFQKKQIEGGTLESNGILSDSILNLVIRLSGGGDNGKEEPEPNLPALKRIKVRDNFTPLACFTTNVFTDSKGEAIFPFTLPDNLTKYRVMAFALTNDSFGTGETFFTSTLPVMIRPSPPRFLHMNDECTFGVVVQNIVDYEVAISIAFQTTSCSLALQGAKTTIPPNSRVIVPCKVKAMVPNSKCSFHAVVASRIINEPSVTAEFTDAVKFSFPIHSPTSTESTVISHILSGSKNDKMHHSLTIPNWNELDQETGGLSINMSCSRLSKLTPAFKYLLEYSNACSEQLSSKLMSLFVMSDLPEMLLNSDEAFPSKEEIQESAQKMFDTLQNRLLNTGEFKYWNGTSTYEYVNIYIYWVLNSIKAMGAKVPEKLLTHSKKYLKSITDTFDKKVLKTDGSSYLKRISFAIYVLHKFHGVSQKETVNDIIREAKDKKGYAQLYIYLMPIIAPSSPKLLNDLITITGSMAYLESGNIDGFYSKKRDSAMLVNILLETFPDHPLIPKLMVGLESMSKADEGRWFNTLDNAHCLYALHSYVKTTNLAATNFTAQIYLNDKTVDPKEVSLSTQSAPSYTRFIPIKTIIKNQGDLFVTKNGKGDMFYSLSFSYAPLNPFYPAVSDRGFSIERTFIPLGNSTDVTVPEGSNVVTIKSGSKVKVQIKVNVKQMTTLVFIKDRLPAGLEPIHTTPYRQYWYSHMNLRESGAEVFVDHFYPGSYVFSYTVTALSYGTFICPPAKVCTPDTKALARAEFLTPAINTCLGLFLSDRNANAAPPKAYTNTPPSLAGFS
eukprot:gene6721-7814_t